jgi:hypothetical protein
LVGVALLRSSPLSSVIELGNCGLGVEGKTDAWQARHRVADGGRTFEYSQAG